MSRKRINYCENMYKSISLIGVSVWWLKMGFWAVVDRKYFSLPRISRKCSEGFGCLLPQVL